MISPRSMDGGELASQDRDEEVPRTAGGFEESGVDALGLMLDEVEHVLDEPGRGEHFAVVCDALLRLHQARRSIGGEAKDRFVLVALERELHGSLPVKRKFDRYDS
jgi:hypothetical protein